MKSKDQKAGKPTAFKDYESYRAFYFPNSVEKGKGIEAGPAILGADLAKATILELTQKVLSKKRE